MIRKSGKTAMSLLEGHVVGALQIHKYLIYYLALVCCTFIAGHLAENALIQEKEKVLIQEIEKVLRERENMLSVMREFCGSETHYQLGKMYYEQKQYEKAIIWYKYALQNYLSRDYAKWAQYRLGTCYEKGLGVKPDTLRAIEWYKKAYEGGNYVSEAGTAYQRLEQDLQKQSNK
jgi:tetratricopeptide (TPR) repeat protein